MTEFSFKDQIMSQYKKRVKATAPLSEVDAYIFCTSSKYLGERLFAWQSLAIKVIYGLWQKYPLSEEELDIIKILEEEWHIDLKLAERNPNQFIEILILVLGRRSGKCLKEGSLVIDPKTGERVPIESLYNSGVARVLTLKDNFKLKRAFTTQVHDNGIKPCYKLTTRSGRSISATANHPFRILNGWTNLEDLKIGDRLAVPRKLNITGAEIIPDNEVRLLGFFIGDGHTVDKCTFTNIIPEVCKTFDDDIKALSPDLVIRHYGIGRTVVQPTLTRVIDRTIIQKFVENHGLRGKHSWDKVVPEVIFKSTNRQIALFLSAIYACDGWVDKKSIGYSSSSKQLIDEMQHLLLRFGVNSTIRILSAPYYKDKNEVKVICRPSYRLEITAAEDIKIFADDIGIIGKNIKLKNLSIKKGSRILHNNQAQSIPKDIWVYIKNKVKEKRLKVDKIFKGKSLYRSSLCSPSRKILKEFGEALNDNYLKNLGDSDVYWDSIKSIEYDGEHQTYDLTIDDTHNFICNDIITHNSSLISFVQTYEAYKLLCKGDPQRYYKLRDRHTIWLINCAKDGDQAQDPFRLCKDNIRRIPFFGKYVDWSKDNESELRLFTAADLFENDKIKKYNEDRPKGAPKKNLLEGSVMIAAFTTSAASKRGKAIICVRGDTLLFTEKGMMQIKDIVPFTDTKVIEKTVKLFGSTGPKTTSKVMCSGTSPGFTARTKLGFELTGTPEHKIKYMTKDGTIGFKSLNELIEGDWVSIQKGQNYFGTNINLPFTLTYPIKTSYKDVTIPIKMSKELARILGYLVAEGYVKHAGYFMFSNKDIEVINDFVYCIKYCFPDVHIGQKIKKSDCYVVEVSSKKIREFLKHIGLSLAIHDKKEIPWSILQSPKEYVTEFIKAYFEGDGCVAKGTNQYQGQLYMSTTSEQLAQQLQTVFLNLDIVASKRDHKSGGYLIVINGISDILKYSEQIGMQSTYRTNRLNSVLQKNMVKQSAPKKYRVPNLKIKLRKLYELNLSKAYKMFNNQLGLNDRECIGMVTLKKVLEKFKEYSNTSEYTEVQAIFDFSKDIIWDKIVKKEISEECLMFDVEVPDTHDFTSNGYISHNCLVLDEFAHFDRAKSIGGGALEEDILAEMPQTDYAMLKALSPSTKDFNLIDEQIFDGKIIMISSPREKGGEFYRHYCLAGGWEQNNPQRADINPNYLMMQLASWQCNPKYPRSVFDGDFAKDAVGAGMEYGGHFGEPSTSFIDASKVDNMVIVDLPMNYFGKFQAQYIISVDPAAKGDTYAVAWGHSSGDMIVVDGVHGFRPTVVINQVTGKVIQVPVNSADVVDYIILLTQSLGIYGNVLEVVFDQWNCLPESAMLYTRDGLKSIKDLVTTNEPIDVATKDGTFTATNFYDNGVRPVRKITTVSGHSLKLTDNHPVWTKGGWKDSIDLKIGEKIAIKSGELFPTNDIISGERALIYGYLTSEGDCTGKQEGTFTFCNTDIELLDEYEKLVKSEFNIPTYKRLFNKKYYQNKLTRLGKVVKYDSVQVHSQKVDLILKNDEVHGNSFTKRVPKPIREGSPYIVREYLSALYEGDGNIGGYVQKTTKYKQTDTYVEYNTRSQQLAQDVQLLLLNLGIIAVLKAFIQCGEYTYRLMIRGENIENFAKLIGFRSRRKAAQLYEVMKYRNNIDKFRCKKYFDKDGIYWSPIHSIEELPAERVYDITVPGPHSFIANGIVTHNSQDSITKLKQSNIVAVETFFTNKYKNHMYTNFLEKLNQGMVKSFGSAPEKHLQGFPEAQMGWLDQMKLELKYMTKTISADTVKYAAPTSGPIQTDDFADVLANLVHRHVLYMSGDRQVYKDLFKQTGRPIQRATNSNHAMRAGGMFGGQSKANSASAVRARLGDRIGRK